MVLRILFYPFLHPSHLPTIPQSRYFQDLSMYLLRKMQRFVPAPECCGLALKIDFFFPLEIKWIRA